MLRFRDFNTFRRLAILNYFVSQIHPQTSLTGRRSVPSARWLRVSKSVRRMSRPRQRETITESGLRSRATGNSCRTMWEDALTMDRILASKWFLYIVLGL